MVICYTGRGNFDSTSPLSIVFLKPKSLGLLIFRLPDQEGEWSCWICCEDLWAHDYLVISFCSFQTWRHWWLSFIFIPFISLVNPKKDLHAWLWYTWSHTRVLCVCMRNLYIRVCCWFIELFVIIYLTAIQGKHVKRISIDWMALPMYSLHTPHSPIAQMVWKHFCGLVGIIMERVQLSQVINSWWALNVLH